MSLATTLKGFLSSLAHTLIYAQLLGIPLCPCSFIQNISGIHRAIPI